MVAETVVYASIGIPQGLIADRPSRTVGGAVRRGGELISLTEADYDLWRSFGTPMTASDVVSIDQRRTLEEIAVALERLIGLQLLADFHPASGITNQLSRLRPIPRGVGAGNLGPDPTAFLIQSAPISQTPALPVDATGVMLWWEFDGSNSLAAAVASVASRLPYVATKSLEQFAVDLVLQLLAKRLIHLDIVDVL